MENKIRVGIIGTGGIAHAHMRAYMEMKDVEIVGGADIIPGKARAFFDEFGLTDAIVFEDHVAMLEELELDAVSVCTYNSTHSICTIDALKKGLNVLCEKPMSVTIQQAADMAKAQKESGKILTIGFQPRYDPNMVMVKNLVRSGMLGDIYYIQTGGGRRRGMPGGTFIREDLAGVGCLADIGCYALDMVLNSIGYRKPLTVSAYATNHFGTNPKYHKESDKFTVDDFSAAFIRLEGDLVIDFRMSWASHVDTMGDTVFLGKDAALKVKSPGLGSPWGGAWDGGIGPVFLYQDICGEMTETAIPLKPESTQRFYLKCRSFIDAVKIDGPSPIPWQEIIYNQAIIDGIYRSSKLHKEVEVIIPEI